MAIITDYSPIRTPTHCLQTVRPGTLLTEPRIDIALFHYESSSGTSLRGVTSV